MYCHMNDQSQYLDSYPGFIELSDTTHDCSLQFTLTHKPHKRVSSVTFLEIPWPASRDISICRLKARDSRGRKSKLYCNTDGQSRNPSGNRNQIFSHGLKRPRREVDHSPPTGAEVNTIWIYTSVPPVRIHGAVRNQLIIGTTIPLIFQPSWAVLMRRRYDPLWNFKSCLSIYVLFPCRVRGRADWRRVHANTTQAIQCLASSLWSQRTDWIAMLQCHYFREIPTSEACPPHLQSQREGEIRNQQKQRVKQGQLLLSKLM